MRRKERGREQGIGEGASRNEAGKLAPPADRPAGPRPPGTAEPEGASREEDG